MGPDLVGRLRLKFYSQFSSCSGYLTGLFVGKDKMEEERTEAALVGLEWGKMGYKHLNKFPFLPLLPQIDRVHIPILQMGF